MRSLIALVVVALFTCCCSAQMPSFGNGGVQFDPNKKITGHDDGQGHLMYRSGQTIDLPQGRDRLCLTVAVPRNFQSDQAAYRVASWFTGGAPAKDGTFRSTNARLRQIQDQTAYKYIFTDDPNWSQTMRAEMLGTGVCVMLTSADGKIARTGDGGLLMFADQLSQVDGPDEMADLLLAASEKYTDTPKLQGLIPGLNAITPAIIARDCPDCNPGLGPAPPINPPSQGPRLVAVVPNPRKSVDSLYTGIAVAVGAPLLVAGLGVALFLRFRK